MTEIDRQTGAGRERADGHSPGASYPNDPSVPDIYVEGVGIQIGYTGISLIFNRVTNEPRQLTAVAVIRMSLEQALVTTQLLRKALQDYQENVGPLHVPQTLLTHLGIDEEL